jgi:hypothetical protein
VAVEQVLSLRCETKEKSEKTQWTFVYLIINLPFILHKDWMNIFFKSESNEICFGNIFYHIQNFEQIFYLFFVFKSSGTLHSATYLLITGLQNIEKLTALCYSPTSQNTWNINRKTIEISYVEKSLLLVLSYIRFRLFVYYSAVIQGGTSFKVPIVSGVYLVLHMYQKRMKYLLNYFTITFYYAHRVCSVNNA